MKSLSILQVFRKPSEHEKTQAALIASGVTGIKVTRVDSVQEAIERIELNEKFDLIVFEQRTLSTSITNLLFQVTPGFVYIVTSLKPEFLVSLKSLPHTMAFADQNILEKSIPLAITELKTKGKFPTPKSEFNADDFVPVNYELITQFPALKLPLFIKVDGEIARYEGAPPKPASAGVKSDSPQIFHLLKTDYNLILKAHAAQLQEAAKKDNLSEAETHKAVQKSHDLVRDVIKESGFTEEAQKVAKASVEMTVKLIGQKPKLSEIMADLKQKEGPYIPSHSIMLGRLACGMAFKVGWHSPATYFKLTLAAFMHDITLDDTKLAKITSTQFQNPDNGLTPDEIKKIKLHPISASEYTRKFSEIPSDVDQIVLQHHEKADGTGFPRGLNAKYISPLSTLFILAHEMIDYSLENPGASLDSFFKLKDTQELPGAFKKIVHSLATDTPIS